MGARWGGLCLGCGGSVVGFGRVKSEESLNKLQLNFKLPKSNYATIIGYLMLYLKY